MLMRYIGETDELMFIYGKVYNVLGQVESGWWRIVDESSEVYMYPSIESFVEVKYPSLIPDKVLLGQDYRISAKFEDNSERVLDLKVYVQERPELSILFDNKRLYENAHISDFGIYWDDSKIDISESELYRKGFSLSQLRKELAEADEELRGPNTETIPHKDMMKKLRAHVKNK